MPDLPFDNWVKRRRIIYGALAFCVILNLSILFGLSADLPEDTQGAFIMWSFTLSTGIIGSYVFGAVWDDKK